MKTSTPNLCRLSLPGTTIWKTSTTLAVSAIFSELDKKD